MDTVIKARNLCCKSGKRYLLNQINWEVKRGEHWLIFGLNGSGKTTLLSIIAGFHRATSGELEVLGQTYSNETILQLRRKIGWVSSSFFDKYLKEEAVLDIVLSGLFGTLGIAADISAADVRRAKALLKELRMDGKMNRSFASLSKGERQNVLIARALMSRPEILVLDEPATGLDIYAREHLRITIEVLAKTDITILYVTHYPEEMYPVFTKTLLLRGGRVFAQGDTDKMMTGEQISAMLNERVQIASDESGRLQMVMQAPSHLYEICFGEEVVNNE